MTLAVELPQQTLPGSRSIDGSLLHLTSAAYAMPHVIYDRCVRSASSTAISCALLIAPCVNFVLSRAGPSSRCAFSAKRTRSCAGNRDPPREPPLTPHHTQSSYQPRTNTARLDHQIELKIKVSKRGQNCLSHTPGPCSPVDIHPRLAIWLESASDLFCFEVE